MKRMMAGSAALALIFTHAAFAQENPVSRMVISPDGKMVAVDGNSPVQTAPSSEEWSETVTPAENSVVDLTSEIMNGTSEIVIESQPVDMGAGPAEQIADETGAIIPESAPVETVTLPVLSPTQVETVPLPVQSPASTPQGVAPRSTVGVLQIPSPPAPPRAPASTVAVSPVMAPVAAVPSPVSDIPAVAAVVQDTPAAALPALPFEVSPADQAAVVGTVEEPVVDLAPRFDGASEIAKRSRISRELETITLETQRFEALQAVVSRIGVDNAVALYPDLAQTISMSPMGLEARIIEAELINDLREAIEGPKEEAAAQAPAPAPGQTAPAPVIGDPSVMNMPVGAPVAMSREDVMAMIQEVEDEEEVSRSNEPQQSGNPSASSLYVVTEIYGTSDNMIAVLRSGTDLIKVREGDELPDGAIVGVVTPNEVVMDFEGEERTIRLR